MPVCKEFYDGFLDRLNEDTRDKVTEAMHDYKNYDLKELNKMFEDISCGIEEKHGVDSLMGHVIVDHFAKLLNKMEDKDGAIRFLERKLKRIGKDEFHTLVTLTIIHQRNGQYQEAIQMLERAKKLAKNDLEMALINVKLAADYWNFESNSTRAYGYLEKGINLLESVENDREIVLHSPSTEQGLLYIDAYKTAAYLYRIQNEKQSSRNCYGKALSIIKKNPKAKLQYLKTLTQRCSVEADLSTSQSPMLRLMIFPSIEEAVSIADELVEDEIFMEAHADSISHIFSRLAHCYQILKVLDKSLVLRLKTLEILKERFGIDHPEAARISADIALNYFLMKDRSKCDEHIQFAEEVLENTNYKVDIVKAKLYFREISDSLRILGNLFSLMSEFGDSERQYLNSIELHDKVYGENHQRVSRVYRFLGNMYSKWEKKDKAIANLNKAIEIQKLYLPASRETIEKIEEDLKRVRNPKQRSPKRRSRGRPF